jgi:3-hydroxy acid dehydrogenase / malonic semialdehyde reductase
LKTILITGATSGFGKACAELFAQHHYRLIITGRRADKLEALAKALTDQTVEVLPLIFDIQDKQACFSAIENLPEKWRKIDVLLNNAGLALGRDTFDEADMDDWETMLDTNVKGLLYMSRAVLPLMKQTGGGHIINIGSTAGKEVYERGNVYCASKFAVGAISRAMRIDLLPHKIKVTLICPGAAETEFSNVRFKGDDEKAAAVYAGYKPLSANDVAEIIYYTTTLPAHVCINDLEITPLAQASAVYTFKE